MNGATTTYHIYKGNDNDYFDFSSNGILDTKEALTTNTFSYSLMSTNEITLVQSANLIYSVPQSGTYIFFGNRLKITVAPNLTNPGFSFQRIIDLKR